MLSSADRAICARDPALPGLAEILDASAMASILGLRSLVPTYLRYKPGVSCTAAFLHPDAGPLAAYAYPRDRYAEIRSRADMSSDPMVSFLDAKCILVVPARLDPHLRALRRFLDPARRPKYLRKVISRREGFCKGEIRLLRYKPGRRLVARIDWKGKPRVALKITGAQDFNSALIGAAGAAAHGGASLVGASSLLRALVTGWVEGESICPELLGYTPDIAAVSAAGAALANLHTDPFRPAASVMPADDAGALSVVADDLAFLDVDLSRQAKSIGTEISLRISDAHFVPALVHGDFSADQIVISKDRPVIIDWDNAACGDPSRDIGTFLARLDAQAEDGFLTRSEADNLGAALVEGYAREAGAFPSVHTAHHARALLLIASEGFRMRRPNWPDRAAALIGRAAALVSRSPRSRRDPAMPELDGALNTCRVLPEIVCAMGDGTLPSLRLAPPELIRHKSARRALVRYRFEGEKTKVLLGKIRAKGPDRRTPQVHRALRAAGLDGLADHGVGVPRALGRVDTLHMWLQEEVSGDPLAQYLDPARSPETKVLARIGGALAHLHAVPAVVDHNWSFVDEAAVLRRAIEKAARNMPEEGNALCKIVVASEAQLEKLSNAPVCGIHRDFYFDQVLVDSHRTWILDLDLYAIGDPAIDIGNFLAHLDEFALRRFGDRNALAAQAAAFLAGYAEVMPLPTAHRIATLRSVSLARHIHISTLFKDRRHITHDLISISLASLTTLESKTS